MVTLACWFSGKPRLLGEFLVAQHLIGIFSAGGMRKTNLVIVDIETEDVLAEQGSSHHDLVATLNVCCETVHLLVLTVEIL